MNASNASRIIDHVCYLFTYIIFVYIFLYLMICFLRFFFNLKLLTLTSVRNVLFTAVSAQGGSTWTQALNKVFFRMNL